MGAPDMAKPRLLTGARLGKPPSGPTGGPAPGQEPQPWRALKRGFRLLMTYTRPRRRTTRQPFSRSFAVFSELMTFIVAFPNILGGAGPPVTSAGR